MTKLDDLILASVSPRRAEILASLGIRVEIIPSAYDERSIPDLSPTQLALAHASGKARNVAERCPGRVVVSADTVVDVDGQIFGKPRDDAEAAVMLRTLSGRSHLVHSAVCLIAGEASRHLEFCATTRVWFYPLTEREIAGYIATGEPRDKAGAYGIQGRGATLVERIDGDFYTVMGFPLAQFVRSLPAVDLCYRCEPGA